MIQSFLKLKFKLIIVAFITALFFLSSSLQEISANSFQQGRHEISIEILDDRSANFTIKKVLENKDAEKFIGGYQYAFLGYRPSRINAKLGGQPVTASSHSVNEFQDHMIDLSFSTNAIKPGQSKELVLEIRVNQFVQSLGNAYFAQFWKSQDKIDQFSMTYSGMYGMPTFYTSHDNNAQVSNSEILVQNPDSFLVMWGSEYYKDLSSEFLLSQGENRTQGAIFNLLPDSSTQNVIYKSLYGANFGAKNDLGTVFGVAELLSNETRDISFEARVHKKYQGLSLTTGLQKYNFTWNPENTKLAEILNSELSELEQLKQLNQRIISEFSVVQYGSQEFIDSESLWANFEKNTEISAFESCFLTVSLAEKLGLNAEIRYGYAIVPDGRQEIVSPHIWCVLSDGAETFLVDPFLEEISGYKYFGANSDFDRITIGTWHPLNQYDTALGILQPGSTPQSITFRSFDLIENDPLLFTFSLTSETIKPYVGLPFSADIHFSHTAQKILNLTNVYLGKTLQPNSLRWLDNLNYVFLPYTNNKVALKGLRNNSLIFPSLGKTFLVFDHTVNSENNSFEVTLPVQYKMHIPILFVSVVIFLIVCAFLIIFFKRR